MRHDLLTNLLAAVYLYFECMMIGTITANAIAARYVPKKDKDFIIPGCATRKDGTPTPLLRGRLDLPPDFAEAQRAETEKAPIFILSGGKGADECISEAECMRRYLSAQGVPEEQLLLEDNSTDTAETMAFSKKADPGPGSPWARRPAGLLANAGRRRGENRLFHNQLPRFPLRPQGAARQAALTGDGLQIQVVLLA